MIHKIIVICFIMMNIASCSSSNNRNLSASQTSNISSSGGGLSSLPAQELNKGECAIFLWGIESARPLVFTQTIKSGDAKSLIDNTAFSLIRQQASNVVIPGFYEEQTFSFNQGIVSLKLRSGSGRNLYEGIKIPSGIMNIKNNDNSEYIISVSGLLGCNLD